MPRIDMQAVAMIIAACSDSFYAGPSVATGLT